MMHLTMMALFENGTDIHNDKGVEEDREKHMSLKENNVDKELNTISEVDDDVSISNKDSDSSDSNGKENHIQNGDAVKDKKEIHENHTICDVEKQDNITTENGKTCVETKDENKPIKFKDTKSSECNDMESENKMNKKFTEKYQIVNEEVTETDMMIDDNIAEVDVAQKQDVTKIDINTRQEICEENNAVKNHAYKNDTTDEDFINKDLSKDRDIIENNADVVQNIIEEDQPMDQDIAEKDISVHKDISAKDVAIKLDLIENDNMFKKNVAEERLTDDINDKDIVLEEDVIKNVIVVKQNIAEKYLTMDQDITENDVEMHHEDDEAKQGLNEDTSKNDKTLGQNITDFMTKQHCSDTLPVNAEKDVVVNNDNHDVAQIDKITNLDSSNSECQLNKSEAEKQESSKNLENQVLDKSEESVPENMNLEIITTLETNIECQQNKSEPEEQESNKNLENQVMYRDDECAREEMNMEITPYLETNIPKDIHLEKDKTDKDEISEKSSFTPCEVIDSKSNEDNIKLQTTNSTNNDLVDGKVSKLMDKTDTNEKSLSTPCDIIDSMENESETNRSEVIGMQKEQSNETEEFDFHHKDENSVSKSDDSEVSVNKIKFENDSELQPNEAVENIDFKIIEKEKSKESDTTEKSLSSPCEIIDPPENLIDLIEVTSIKKEPSNETEECDVHHKDENSLSKDDDSEVSVNKIKFENDSELQSNAAVESIEDFKIIEKEQSKESDTTEKSSSTPCEIINPPENETNLIEVKSIKKEQSNETEEDDVHHKDENSISKDDNSEVSVNRIKFENDSELQSNVAVESIEDFIKNELPVAEKIDSRLDKITEMDVDESSHAIQTLSVDTSTSIDKSTTEENPQVIEDAETCSSSTVPSSSVLGLKLNNNLDILSDDDDTESATKLQTDALGTEVEKTAVSNREEDSNKEGPITIDDDDIMVIEEDSISKTDIAKNISSKSDVTDVENHTDVEMAVSKEENKPDHEGKVPEAVEENKKQEVQKTTEKEAPKPLVPHKFLTACKKNLADMTREDLEEYCVLRIVDSIVDRTSLSEIKTKLKTMAQNIEEYKKKAMMLTKQNRDLQVVLKSVQEEQRKHPGKEITPLKITRSVGMQILMTEVGGKRKSGPIPAPPLAGSPSTNHNVSKPSRPNTNKNQKPTNQSNNTQNIPVPRLIPASNATKSPSTVSPAKVNPSAIAPKPPAAPPKPEKRPRSSSVTVDLTDDEPPLKVTARNTPAPVRCVPPQNLLAPRPGSQKEPPRKVYIPIGGPQANTMKPGQTLMLKTVRPGEAAPMIPGPRMHKTPNIVRIPNPSGFRMSRPQSRHPAPLPDVMKQYQPPNWKALPPAPDLKLSKVENGIVISWKIEGYQEDSYEEISSYQLYAYQETSSPPSTSLWKKIGDVKALPLPMACTLTQFMAGYKYYFAVRAVDIRSRLGPFSLPGSILLLSKT